MVKQSPKIDPRTDADIEQQVNNLLNKYVPDWKEPQPDRVTGKTTGISVALIKIFARYCEIIIERLNKVPEKNFLAFLDLLGASQLPPQSAQVPLTFSLATGTTVDAVVPKGTQVAAQLTTGEKQPVIFETENNLIVTAAKLQSIFVLDPQQRLYDDYSTIITTIASDDLPVFRGKRPLAELFQSPELLLEKAFTNKEEIDLSTGFFPFGKEPKFGDSFYLANSKIFAQNQGKITLKIELALASDYSDEEGVTASEKLKLLWAFWNGQRWQELGVTGKTSGTTIGITNTEFGDTTAALTKSGQTGQIEFKLGEEPKPTKVNGIENYWIRVRIVSGKYETTAPPVINYIRASYELSKPVAPENDKPSLYFGFTLPPNCKDFPQKPISLFISLAEPKYNDPLRVESASFETFVGAELKQPQLTWEYSNGKDGKDWAKLTVSDTTENFTRSGVMTFLPPKDFTPREDFGLLLRYWLRVRWESGDYLVEPKLRRVLLNTVMATQTVTISNEILGSSDGSENQKFRTTRSPVLRDRHLEVRESEMPSAQDQINIKRDEGDDAITPILDANGNPTKECWVRWHEVDDFYASVSRDRHYVINHLTGEIQLGNGRNGLIPSLSKNNIRMAYYQTGGGEAGNKPAGTIVQLKTTIPYVNRVTNYEAATGGAEAETVEALIDRIPRRIRHHDRAVTLEDYEDLAREASAEVARAKCFPLRNLAEHPLDETKVPGTVSVIIVPRSTEVKPLPTLELISRVKDYLEARIDPTVNIVVVGPLYVEVKIFTKLNLTALENGGTVEQDIERKLARFLHPLTGGFDGTGWDFGRQPYQSDLYRLLGGVLGIDHVHSLTVTPDFKKLERITEDIRKIIKTNRFLVYSGKHGITFNF